MGYENFCNIMRMLLQNQLKSTVKGRLQINKTAATQIYLFDEYLTITMHDNNLLKYTKRIKRHKQNKKNRKDTFYKKYTLSLKPLESHTLYTDSITDNTQIQSPIIHRFNQCYLNSCFDDKIGQRHHS